MTDSNFSKIRMRYGSVLDGYQAVDAKSLEKERSPVEPGADDVSVAELVELTGKSENAVRSKLSKLGAKTKRTDRGTTVPKAWVKVHAVELFA